MPIEATAAIDIFVRRILIDTLNNFQVCLEEGMRNHVKPFHVANKKLTGEIKILRDSHEAILNTPIPTEQSATTPTFASNAARKPQLPKNNGVPRKVRPVIMKSTQPADEKTITANPLQARGLPNRDFAIRGVPKHIPAEQLSAYLQGIGVKPRFVRIVPLGPDDTKFSTVGRIGIYTSDVYVLLKAENWSSNMTITGMFVSPLNIEEAVD
ncbi:hypothetical protein RvY_16937 [Ramazzottius varieornatus]|uniref:Uncharacterized protein n=1 Tax=Ramazzottius varieornatus TaxID=947166 RepID=A0A1D1W7I9_RAMVA|nr:hypothetical protein RvY_16937 [Ramazzottius varieornatus]